MKLRCLWLRFKWFLWAMDTPQGTWYDHDHISDKDFDDLVACVKKE